MQTTTPISTCQAPGCTNTFPTLANTYQTKKYCNKKCRDRASEASSRRQAYYRSEAGRIVGRRKQAKQQAKKIEIKRTIRETHAVVQACPNCNNYFVSQRPRQYCTPKCCKQANRQKISQERAVARASRACKTCGQPGVRQTFCSAVCQRKHPEQKQKKKNYRNAYNKTPAGRAKKRERARARSARKRQQRKCLKCEKQGVRQKYCSRSCSSTIQNQTRQARKRNAFVEIVSVRKLAKAQNWECWLCNGKIDKTAKAPHPDSLSLDHLIPLSLGGEHSYANCAAAHFRCNALKSNNAVNEQLKLPIPGLVA